MAASSEETSHLADEDEARGEVNLPTFAQQQDYVSAGWMRAGRWREVVSLRNRLVRLGIARQAVVSGERVFVWYGPAVPQFVVVSGQGHNSPPE
jgi:hypothetical protein